jgi:putative hemolysin
MTTHTDTAAKPKRGPIFTLPTPHPMAAMVTRPLEKLSGLSALNGIYAAIPDGCATAREFCGHALDVMKVSLHVSPEDLARIPRQGPFVLVANHPFGAIEGVILAKLIGDIRPDFKFMANFLLTRIPEMRSILISVDPFGGRGAPRRNIGPLRECLTWLRGGGALGVFPSGEVAHLHPRRRFSVTDPVWNPNIGGLIRRAGVPVVPIFFSGRNTAVFQALGLVHPLLRTAMLPRELLNKRGGAVTLHVGQPIPPERMAKFKSDAELTEYLRFRTFLMRNRTAPHKTAGLAPAADPRGAKAMEPIPEADHADLLHAEVESLPPGAVLTETDEFNVFCAAAAAIPRLLREIGRQREITFRKVGEGTGKGLDLDPFDTYYQHLVVWNHRKHELVGAYRIGKVDEIIRGHGVKGLYTHTLFQYRPDLLANLGGSLELGRSFVRPEYQRSFSPLLLLWKGIGQLVVRNPAYKYLVGPVSISNDYNSVSRQLLAAFLRINHLPSELAGHVHPRNPLRPKQCGDIDPQKSARFIQDLDEISSLIAEIERDGKGIPVLLRQYLKLGGVILGLNVDPDFNNCLDGLVLVDLTKTEPRLLEKYLGKDGTAAFLNWHRRSRLENPAAPPA